MTSGNDDMVRTSVKLTRDEFARVADGTYPAGQVPRSGEPVTIVDKRGSRVADAAVHTCTCGEPDSVGVHFIDGHPCQAPETTPATELAVMQSASRIAETVDPDAPLSDQIAVEVRNRTVDQLKDHDRVVQNEIARSFYQGEVLDAARAEQRAVNTALQTALSSVLGEIAKR